MNKNREQGSVKIGREMLSWVELPCSSPGSSRYVVEMRLQGYGMM